VDGFALVALVLLAGLALPFKIHSDQLARRKQLAGWQRVAQRLGLQAVEHEMPLWGNPRLSGRAGRHRITFERVQQEKDTYITRVKVEGNSGITLRSEGSTSVLAKMLDEREIELGDQTFDDEVLVHGAPDRVRALLDAETRRLVSHMLKGHLMLPDRRPVSIAGSVTLVDGDLDAAIAERPHPPEPEHLYEVAGALLALAERFERPADVAARLASAVEREPLWRVRLQGLVLLSTSYPKDPATAAALRRALADDHAEVRLQAALTLDAGGRATLLELAKAERVDDAIAARAVDALADRLSAEVAESILHQALRLRRLKTADACIRAFGPVGGRAAVPLLGKVLDRENGPLALAAAQALGRIRAPEDEAALVRALARDEPELLIAAIEALGHTGSVDAVLPIRDAADGPGSNGDVRRAARQAVAEIQSRLPGASPGQLSIAGGEAGQLSLADDDPRGRVSLPD
jgi:hypothetical protein